MIIICEFLPWTLPECAHTWAGLTSPWGTVLRTHNWNVFISFKVRKKWTLSSKKLFFKKLFSDFQFNFLTEASQVFWRDVLFFSVIDLQCCVRFRCTKENILTCSINRLVCIPTHLENINVNIFIKVRIHEGKGASVQFVSANPKLLIYTSRTLPLW